MKAILAAALVLGVCGLAGAADDKKVDPVGTWKCEYEIGGAKRTATLTIKKDGDKLDGAMTWPDQKDTKVKDLKLKDGTLTFSVVRKFMDNEFTADYTLTIDGDKLKGKAAAELGGQKREWHITGQRGRMTRRRRPTRRKTTRPRTFPPRRRAMTGFVTASNVASWHESTMSPNRSAPNAGWRSTRRPAIRRTRSIPCSICCTVPGGTRNGSGPGREWPTSFSIISLPTR